MARKAKKRVSWWIRVLRTLVLTACLVGGIYWYQPNRIDLIPRKLPVPNPPIDEHKVGLFKRGARVAIVTAHPDDAEFFIGGTLTKLRAVGTVPFLIVCTDGDKAYYPFEDHEANRRIRRAETILAMKAWGGDRVTFLAQPDGRLGDRDEVRQMLQTELDKIQPTHILCFDGDFPPRVSHADHRNSGVMTEAVAPSIGSARWLMKFSTIAANYTVDVTSVWDKKEKLVQIHRSQFVVPRTGLFDRIAGRPGSPWPLIDGVISDMAYTDGTRIGVEYGEGFRAISLDHPK